MSLKAPKVDRQWNPIESAPRDGRKVFLYDSHHGKDVIRGRFKPGVGWVNNSGFPLLWRPTHWVPIEALNEKALSEYQRHDAAANKLWGAPPRAG